LHETVLDWQLADIYTRFFARSSYIVVPYING